MYTRVVVVLLFVCVVNICVGEECGKDCLKPDPCNPDDEPCVAAIVNHYAAPVISKVVKDSFAESECLSIDEISGKFSTLKYRATCNNVTGLECCNLTKLNVSPDVAVAQFVFECPAYVVTGEYEVCGYFLYIPVIGKGTYVSKFGNHCVTVYSQIKRVKGCEGKTHLQLGDFTTDVKALSPIKFDHQNLYKGNVQLAELADNFASCHWKEMSLFTNEPVWNNVIVKVFTASNKKLLRLPAEKLFMCQ